MPTPGTLIIGGGLAGTCLALHLHAAGQRVQLIDSQLGATGCSRIAAGLINPITGKRFVKSWQLETAWPLAQAFYTQWESALGARFFYPTHVTRIFGCAKEATRFEKRAAREDYAPWVNATLPAGHFSHALGLPKLNDAFGSGRMHPAARVNTAAFLTAAHTHLQKEGAFTQANFNYEALNITENTSSQIQAPFTWEGVQAHRIIFCEGWRLLNNPFFKAHAPLLQPTAGDILTLRTTHPLPEDVLVRLRWAAPTPELGENTLRFGATYRWDTTDETPSEKAKGELLGQYRKFFGAEKNSAHVLEHTAGIRPISPDKHPFITLHPQHPGMYALNGLSSKGALMAPYMAHAFSKML